MDCLEKITPMIRSRVKSCGANFGLRPNKTATKSRYRVVMMGAAETGKSALVHRLITETMPRKYKPTVEDMHHYQVTHKQREIHLDILDTSGSFSFPAMRRLSIISGDIFLLCFSLEEPDSLDEVYRLKEEIYREKGENAVVLIVGTHADVKGRETYRKVIDATLTIDKGLNYMETSSLSGYDVKETFVRAVILAECKNSLKSPSLFKSCSVKK